VAQDAIYVVGRDQRGGSDRRGFRYLQCSQPVVAWNECTGTIRAAAAVNTRPEDPGRIQLLRRHDQYEPGQYESALLYVEAERQVITTL